ncbi:hypothetical protein DDP48_01540 [Helicobacter pylori]|nr:hypothetical protein DDP48_01540 [Helicobacter pylori]
MSSKPTAFLKKRKTNNRVIFNILFCIYHSLSSSLSCCFMVIKNTKYRHKNCLKIGFSCLILW